MLSTDLVDLKYIGNTEALKSMPTVKTMKVKGEKVRQKTFADHPVEVAPRPKKMRYYDPSEQREKTLVVRFTKEDDGEYYARNVPREAAVRINKAQNYEILEESLAEKQAREKAEAEVKAKAKQDK